MRRVTTLVMLASLTACSTSSSTPVTLPGRHLTSAKFNDGTIGGMTNIWPLKVDSGTVSCLEVTTQDGLREFAVVFTTDDGSQYSLNGAAENTGRFHPGLEIYLPDSYANGSPDPQQLIGYGLRLCPRYKSGARQFRQP